MTNWEQICIFIITLFQTNSPRGWDFVVQWVLHIVKTRRSRRGRRRRRKRDQKQNNNVNETSTNYDFDDEEGESSLDTGARSYMESSDFVINFQNCGTVPSDRQENDISPCQIISLPDRNHIETVKSSYATQVWLREYLFCQYQTNIAINLSLSSIRYY